jgi:hypothetical protein
MADGGGEEKGDGFGRLSMGSLKILERRGSLSL